MALGCAPTLINNTIAYNILDQTAGTYGAGIYAFPDAGYTGANNILYFNQAITEPNASGPVLLEYSCCPETLPGTGNITTNPLFVNGPAYNFNLQAGSPCIDTGDPASPLDPDSTRADMGALYFDQSTPTVSITLVPVNPPIQIPAGGGSFNFNATLDNNESTSQTFDVWIMIQLPNGAWYGPALGPITLTLPANLTLHGRISGPGGV